MKTLSAGFIGFCLLACACTKNDLQSPVIKSANASEADLSVVAKSKTALITAHTWMYQGYYFHYIDQSHKGDVEYVRGNSNNPVNLDDDRITFKKNGSFLETEGGYSYPGTWQFTDGADTSFSMAYDYGVTNKNKIVTLTNKKLYYTHPIGSYSHGNFAYTELIPAQ